MRQYTPDPLAVHQHYHQHHIPHRPATLHVWCFCCVHPPTPHSPQDSLAKTTSVTEAEAFSTTEGKKKKILAVVVTSDRGLCGGVNSAVCRSARQSIIDLTKAGHDLKVFPWPLSQHHHTAVITLRGLFC